MFVEASWQDPTMLGLGQNLEVDEKESDLKGGRLILQGISDKYFFAPRLHFSSGM